MLYFRIIDGITDLSFLHSLIDQFGQVKIFENLEIEPHSKFSIEFQADYWYLKYMLLSNKSEILTNDFRGLLNEKNINIIWLYITDDKYFIIECLDGMWNLKYLAKNDVVESFFSQFKLEPVI